MNFTGVQTALLTWPTLAFGLYFFWQAKGEGRYQLLTFVGLMLYAFTLEFADVHTTQDYSYSALLPMIGSGESGIPLEVPISWAVILHCCMRTSDRLGMPWHYRPFFDGLLAVLLDLVLDPILSASRAVPALGGGCLTGDSAPYGGLGMWIWCIPPTLRGFWINVPLVNFVGWVFVVIAVSYAIRRGAQQLGGNPTTKQMLVRLGTNLAVALLSVVGIMLLYKKLFPGTHSQQTVLAVAMLVPAVILWQQRATMRFANPVDWPVLGFFLSMILPYSVLFYLRGTPDHHDEVHYGLAVLLVLGLVLMPYRRGTTAASQRAA